MADGDLTTSQDIAPDVERTLVPPVPTARELAAEGDAPITGIPGRTRYERINGFAGLRRGLRNVEATVRRSDGRWVAIHVEISGGGGEHGGSDDD